MSATRHTFKVHFYVKWKEVQEDGKVPIFGRITINGEPKTFSTQQSVSPHLWDVPSNRAKGKSVEDKNVNDKLDDIHTRIKNTYDSLKKENPSVTAEEVRNSSLGVDVVDENKTILYQLDEYYKEWGKRVKESTAQRHVYYRNAFAAYIPKKYGVSDIPFIKLNKEFLVNYYNYLLDELNYSSGTAYKAIQKIQRIGFICIFVPVYYYNFIHIVTNSNLKTFFLLPTFPNTCLSSFCIFLSGYRDYRNHFPILKDLCQSGRLQYDIPVFLH